MKIQQIQLQEWIIGIFLLIYLFFSWNYMSISNDALYQLTVLNNHFYGYGFMDNLMIDKNYVANEEILKWWTPLPYLIPYFLSKILFISYSHSISVCLFFSILISSHFLRKIIEMFDFKKNIALLVLLIFVCQRTINLSFLQFSGGDLFIYPIGLFQFLIFYKKVNGENKKKFYLVFLLLSLIGILFKMNYVILALSMLGSLFFDAIRTKNFKEVIYQLLSVFIVSLLVVYFSTGPGTAVSNNSMDNRSISVLQFIVIPILGIFFSFFGLHSILANIPSKENTYFDIMNLWTIEGTILGLIIVIISLLIFGKSIYRKKQIAIFLGIYSMFYSFFYLKGSYVGHEDRYFFIPSIILFIVVLSSITKRFFVTLVLVVGFLFSAYGLWNFSYRFKQYNQTSNTMVENSNLGGIRIPISSDWAKVLGDLGLKIKNRYPGYAIYTSNENYFFINSNNPLIHDWNFQIMGFEKFDIEKFDRIKFAKSSRLNGIIFISPEKLKSSKNPAFEQSGLYVYELKNNTYAN